MKSRWLVVALALASACALAVSVWVGAWWTVGEWNVGPFGARGCMGGDCGLRGLSWLDGGDLWMRSAIATGVAGVIAMFLAVAVAGALAAKRVPKLIARSYLASLATALVVGAFFFVKFPGLGGSEQHLGFGAPLYVVGIAIGAVAGIMVQRARSAAP